MEIYCLPPDMTEYLHTDQLPGRTLFSGGQEYLYFSGTSYLGLARHPAFQACLQAGISRYGTNYSSSRLSNVRLSVFEEAENYLSAYTGAPAVLTLSSGYMAGQLVVRCLDEQAALVYAPRTHPALWVQQSNFVAGDFAAWARQLPHHLQQLPQQQVVVLFNSLDPLLAQKYDLDFLQHLPRHKDLTLVIDDSHGFGLTGKAGAGVFSELQMPGHVKVVVISSLGKALGIPAGVILTDAATMASFRQSPFFGGGSPAVPAYLYAFMQAGDLYRQARQQLQHNIRFFGAKLNKPQLFSCIPDYPVFHTSQKALYPYLLEQGILISSFPYPTPSSEPITRIILNASHTEGDLNRLAQAINRFNG
jgi:7-keto-8-aminopelargonate synthetase-like enzyme